MRKNKSDNKPDNKPDNKSDNKPDNKSDNKPDIQQVVDRGENLSAMEPLLISESSVHRHELMDLTIELTAKAAGFRRSLPVAIQA